MVLDQLAIRGFADHGAAWTGFAGTALPRLAGCVLRKATPMLDRSLAHLRNLALLMAVLVISAGFIGIAVLPGAVALGLTA
jgi:hypothetical protein